MTMGINDVPWTNDLSFLHLTSLSISVIELCLPQDATDQTEVTIWSIRGDIKRHKKLNLVGMYTYVIHVEDMINKEKEEDSIRSSL